MNGPGIAKVKPTPVSPRWESFRHSAPLLLECLRPLAITAPKRLEERAVIEAILTVYLVNRLRFQDDQATLPRRLTKDQVMRTWSKPSNFWFQTNDRTRMLRYKRFDGTSSDVWPKLEIALRTLIPNLPSQINSIRDFRLPAMQDPGVNAFLHCIALLLGIVTRRTIRPKP